MPIALHSGLFQPDALRIWNPSNCDKKIRTFESALALGSAQTNPGALTGRALDLDDLGIK
jgi:hypothetical protein